MALAEDRFAPFTRDGWRALTYPLPRAE